jgi:hypothetical protein
LGQEAQAGADKDLCAGDYSLETTPAFSLADHRSGVAVEQQKSGFVELV